MKNTVQKAVFAYDRNTMLNVIYDVIDSLNLSIRQINSEQGIMHIETAEGSSLQITVSTLFPINCTSVGISSREITNSWGLIFMDEMRSILKINHHKKPQMIL